MGKKKNDRQVYYLIHSKSGKVIDENINKSALRRKKKAMKNPHMYKISKFDTLVVAKEKKVKKVKKSTGKVKKEKKVRTKKVKKSKKKKRNKKKSLDI